MRADNEEQNAHCICTLTTVCTVSAPLALASAPVSCLVSVPACLCCAVLFLWCASCPLLRLRVCVCRYYVDASGGQQGPALLPAFKAAFASGSTNAEALCWNETMGGWTAIKDVPGLMAQLKPPPAAAARPAPAPMPKPGQIHSEQNSSSSENLLACLSPPG